MTGGLEGSDWACERGEKWVSQLPFMEATLAPIDEPLISALQIDGPLRIADIGCGGGGTTLEAARRAPTGSIVDGFDISPALIETAGARPSPSESGVNFEVADASTAPAPEPAYERLLSRFGVMFFGDQSAAFANLRRWLAPGGRFAFAVWGPVGENPWMTSAAEAVSTVIDLPPGPQIWRSLHSRRASR